ncbi:hypothetical protein, partial [Neoroseomonas rubea]|uniref:hypothetical protein n=1 Tax=Neoroseomonas rubea TaxID=2748666 RepID=UPI001E609AFB
VQARLALRPVLFRSPRHRAGRLPRDAAAAARDRLRAAGVAVAGVVLNAHRDPVPRWLRGWLR